ncbi:MerR family transcriptional regulator [Meridianimarinicoccus aquatilis]|uniref:MerR family DNA-binding transcriptional regulator n=1 Tax=Meridianimarinicoccus aquatilis TaxID=2552766 RepID=A0A4R6B5E2_9RHOB|nr:MerR family DNA-binding transcriptional regulator [Fluviibacterium aquatile]QIE40561.1 MerR family DNA-binding transcriptional regulator [Rhodobacteraceae bacterium SC52]TDL91066.1 MerR family DNA-binding transcriptional regulator [Fluviibacterium aquatile]
MTETMTIREMCDAYNVTPRTLRFYEAKELLSPIRQGQKRLFTRRDRTRLTLILRGKRFGLSLEEIRQILDLYRPDGDPHPQLSEACTIGERHLERMIAQRASLDEAIKELEEQLQIGREQLAEIEAAKRAAE